MFLSNTQLTEIMRKTDKWYFIKVKNFWLSNDIVNKMSKTMYWGKLFLKRHFRRAWHLRYIKNFYRSIIKKLRMGKKN